MEILKCNIFFSPALDHLVDADRLGIKQRNSSKKANLKSKFGNIANYFVSYFADDNSKNLKNMDQLLKDFEDENNSFLILII